MNLKHKYELGDSVSLDKKNFFKITAIMFRGETSQLKEPLYEISVSNNETVWIRESDIMEIQKS